MPTMTARPRKSELAKLYGRGEARYRELCERFPLRPVRTEAELDAATVVVHELIDQDKRSKAEDDYLDVLTDLVEAYEEVHYPMEPVSGASMLAYCMELRNLTQAEVAKGAGIAVSTVSSVLSGKRKLTREHIGKLAKFFNVSPGVFFDD